MLESTAAVVGDEEKQSKGLFYCQLAFQCERTAQVNGVSDHEGLKQTHTWEKRRAPVLS